MLPPCIQEFTSLLGDLPCDGIVLQTPQKPFRFSLFTWPQSRVNLSDVNRAASHLSAISNEFLNEFTPTAFAIENINNDSRIEQTGGDHLFGSSLLIYFFQSLGGFLADLTNPRICTLGEFGMVLVRPASCSRPKCLKLPAPAEFPLHQIDNERGSLPLANNPIDLTRKVAGNLNECSWFAHAFS
ncbi:MAG TPA: hypothetical protein VG672_25620 [Bryobacteraceae bacterium]|nr:hypothetical protein [Bryobacteraceae bacterium]